MSGCGQWGWNACSTESIDSSTERDTPSNQDTFQVSGLGGSTVVMNVTTAASSCMHDHTHQATPIL